MRTSLLGIGTRRITMKTLAMTILALAMSAQAQTFNTLYNFTQQGLTGKMPSGQVTLDTQGNIYGATIAGGTGGDLCGNGNNLGCGLIFELTPANGQWTQTILYNFSGGKDGGQPNGGLIFDPQGNLYGTAAVGGQACSCGLVFEFSPTANGWVETILHEFHGKDGQNPTAGLAFDSAGNLYGSTSQGGTNGSYGTIFELSLVNGSWTFHTIYDMNYLAYQPDGPLVIDSLGSVYGTARYGKGAKEHNGDGVAFRVTPVDGKWNHAFIHIFDAFYREPAGGLLMNADSVFYGTTSTGGMGFTGGEAYQITGGTKWSLETIKPFTQAQGHPTSSLVMDANGNLYGATTGGANGYGMIYRLAAGTWKYTDLYDFPITNPAPDGNLIVDSQGNVYGVTSGDGVNTFGSVWEYQP
jgi:uncharacterized repeat protein (TIGR03803 family)